MMPFTVRPEERVEREELITALDRIKRAFMSMEQWAQADGKAECASYARNMWLVMAAMQLSSAYNDQCHTVRLLLDKVEDEDLREDLQDQIEEIIHIEHERLGLFTVEDDSQAHIQRFPNFLMAYFHAQGDKPRERLSQEAIEQLLSVAEGTSEAESEESGETDENFEEALGEEVEEEGDDVALGEEEQPDDTEEADRKMGLDAYDGPI